MNKKILVVGVIILIIGGALAAVGYNGMMNKSARAMKDDKNGQGGYDSYETGDRVTVTGKITNKTQEPIYGESAYRYHLDDVDGWDFLSSEDIGDEGDRVTVTLKLREGGYWEVRSYSSAMTTPMTLLGLILLIVGVIVAVVGAMKGSEEEGSEEEYDEGMSTEPPEEEF